MDKSNTFICDRMSVPLESRMLHCGSDSCQLLCDRCWRKRIIWTDALSTGPDGRATGSDQDDESLAGQHGEGRGGAEGKSEEVGDVSQQLCTFQHQKAAGKRERKSSLCYKLSDMM